MSTIRVSRRSAVPAVDVDDADVEVVGVVTPTPEANRTDGLKQLERYLLILSDDSLRHRRHDWRRTVRERDEVTDSRDSGHVCTRAHSSTLYHVFC